MPAALLSNYRDSPLIFLRGPALLVVDDEEFLTAVDNHKIAVRFMGRRGDIRSEIQESGAVLIHNIRAGKCSLDQIVIEAVNLVVVKTPLPSNVMRETDTNGPNPIF